MNVQPRILSLVLFDGEFSPYPPVCEGGFVTIFHALEPSSGLLLYFWVSFRVSVDLDVDLEEVLDGVLSQSFLVAVFLKTGSDETELERSIRPRPADFKGANHLSTPIPKIVHRSNIPSVGLVEVCEVCADDCRSEVTDVEVLGYIGGRVLNNNFLSLPRIVPPVIGLTGGRVLSQVVNLGQDFLE